MKLVDLDPLLWATRPKSQTALNLLAEGAKELKNDHRLILEGRVQSRIMLVEVRRVIDLFFY